MSNDIQILAVWGNPCSGKTTTAVKLAMELAAHKKNVVILMCNFMAPAPQTLLPNVTTDGKSLGELLSLPSISQEEILRRCIPLGKSSYISLLGYQRGDNAFTYAKYSKERAIDLITLLRHVADYIIIDCESAFSFDVLSAVALEMADAVLRLCVCDLKSLSYFASALPLLSDSRYASARHIKVLSMVKPGQDNGEYQNTFGGISYSLPFVPGLEEQFYAARLMDELCSKPAAAYNVAIRDMVNNLLLGGEPMAKPKKIWSFLPKQKPAKEKPAKEVPVRSIQPLVTLNKPKPEKSSGGIFGKLRGDKGGRS
jgi:MinD-like ATPase involved in chromosome partitioning or flagellar assembly